MIYFHCMWLYILYIYILVDLLTYFFMCFFFQHKACDVHFVRGQPGENINITRYLKVSPRSSFKTGSNIVWAKMLSTHHSRVYKIFCITKTQCGTIGTELQAWCHSHPKMTPVWINVFAVFIAFNINAIASKVITISLCCCL